MPKNKNVFKKKMLLKNDEGKTHNILNYFQNQTLNNIKNLKTVKNLF